MPPINLMRSRSTLNSQRAIRDRELQSSRSKVTFFALRLDAKTPSTYTEIETSHNQYSSTLTNDDSYIYVVPKCLEGCFEEGELYVMPWELEDDLFTGRLATWRGKYCVWYTPKAEVFTLMKVKCWKDGKVEYMDTPKVEDRDARFWLRSEMADVRDRLVERFGR